MTVITFDMALEALNAAVDEKGADFVYQGEGTFCTYAAYDEPSCIVGNALHRLGVSISTLEKMDHCMIGGAVISSPKVLDVLEDSGFDLDYEAIVLLSTAQVLQDDEVPWGDAVRAARDEPLGWSINH